MRQHLRQLWQSLMIKKKILIFAGSVFVIYFFSALFNIWVVNVSLVDFSRILEQNTQSINLVQALENEISYFQNYVQRTENVTFEMLEEVMEQTKEAVYVLPFDYRDVGEARYARTWSIHNSYEVYVEKREEFLALGRENRNYINDLYEIYEMQEYLLLYARNLMTDTLEMSGVEYQAMVPKLINIPWLAIGLGCLFLAVMYKLAQIMNRTIVVPIMKLVGISKRIAENDFFVEDVQVENEDEIGELVRAFNKMKYATGEYILALEERRKALDLLHAEELEKLEIERRLETTKLDLLKSQVNPHFLFNTLNVIAGMAILEDAQTTEKMITALSSLFRYNLKTDDIVVPLARELKVVEDYMYLQQMRFGERITYDIICDADKERMMVPAFTFQPLVENAIIHGLSHEEEGGKLRIRIRLREDKLHICIGDTGKGMSEEELLALRENLQKQRLKEAVHSGIGLGNIYRRINAMYPEGRVEIYSREAAGTVVKIVIPQKSGGAYVSSNSGR